MNLFGNFQQVERVSLVGRGSNGDDELTTGHVYNWNQRLIILDLVVKLKASDLYTFINSSFYELCNDLGLKYIPRNRPN